VGARRAGRQADHPARGGEDEFDAWWGRGRDDVEGLVVVKQRDGLTHPHRNVGRLHHAHEPFDDGGKFNQTFGVLA
jgi:hypothetical protein